jgi:hypothetical protein
LELCYTYAGMYQLATESNHHVPHLHEAVTPFHATIKLSAQLFHCSVIYHLIQLGTIKLISLIATLFIS